MEEAKNSNLVKLRIKQFVASLGISEREFCRKIGVSSGYIESIKQSISPKVMQTITMHYPQLNPVWLLLGKGEMAKTEEKETPQQGGSSVVGGVLPSEMLAELLVEARNEKARLLANNERLTSVVVSQQETIEELTRELKKVNAQQGGDAECAVVG